MHCGKASVSIYGYSREAHHHHHHFVYRLSLIIVHTKARVRRYQQLNPSNMSYLVHLPSLVRTLSCHHSHTSSMSSYSPPFPTPPTTSKRRHSETQSSAPLRSTCPNHLSLPRLTTLSTLSIPKPFVRSLVLPLSFSVTPDIHLTMLFSVLTSLCISSFFIGQVSLPYTSTLCTHALYIFPFTLNEAPLAVNNILRSLNFPKAHLTLALDASSAPPPFPITSPK